MARMIIWNKQEISAYEHPPIFNTYQRKLFFTLSRSLEPNSFHHLTNQVGFHLMFGYFKACKRFFTPDKFHKEDIGFVCQRLGVFEFSVDMEQYEKVKSSYLRHQRIILDHFAYQPFDPQEHLPVLLKAIERQIHAQLRPRLLLGSVLDWLSEKRIELPSYHRLHTLITDAIHSHKQGLITLVRKHISQDQKQALDRLFEQSGDPTNQPYLITSLKHLVPSEQVKQIRANLEKLKTLWEIFEKVKSLIQAIGLNPDAIRYYGELVIHYEVFQIARRKEMDQYLHLIAFVAYQIYAFEDWLVDTFLSGCKAALNLVQKSQKDYLFTNRKVHRAVFRKLISLSEENMNLLQGIHQIIWNDQKKVNSDDKVVSIQDLLPLIPKLFEENQIKEFKSQYLSDDKELFYKLLENGSLSLQKQVSGIVKQVHFSSDTSNKKLISAIKNFETREGKITDKAPMDFLSEEEKALVFPPGEPFRISLYKALLFKSMFEHIKAGSLNLTYSYRYKAYDEYLIGADTWKTDCKKLLQEAGLAHLYQASKGIETLEKQLDEAYHTCNQNILDDNNPHIRFHKEGKFHIKTPAVTNSDKPRDKESLFPAQKSIPLSEILATVENLTGYLEAFTHLQPRNRGKRPDKRAFFAGITAYGCNMGIPTMANVAFPLSETELEQTSNWYFSIDNINKANDMIVNFTQNLDLPNIYREHQGKLNTSSDGQRIPVNYPYALYASHSAKYFRKGKGVSAYSFVDERDIHFYSTIISSADREAIHVVDGLMHNEIFHSTRHATDSHGQTEPVFGLMHLLGFGFAPRIAKLYKQQLYSFKKRKEYEQLKFKILPDGYINTQLIEDNWDHILRLITSIKLKVCTASQIFKRLNSYSRQHPVYQALKEYGKIIKSIYILQYIDDLELRQIIQRQLNKVEHSNRFSKVVAFANGGEMIFPTRQEQRIAEACKRLIKSAIVCWNYLYLSQKVASCQDQILRHELIEKIKTRSAVAWGHIYFHGLYDFSEKKLTDSFHLKYAQYLSLKTG